MKLTLFGIAAVMAGAMGAFGQPAGGPRHFDVDEYRVEGNTVLPAHVVEDAVYPFLGPDRTVDDVEHARAALEAVYAQHGYSTVSAEVPVQDPSDGVIILKVTERKVGRLRVHGARYFSLKAIKDGAAALAEGTVPNLNDVQKQIIALNQWPDRTVTPVLRPGIEPGTVDVDLNVKDTLPLHASFELNNRQQADTTPLRALASLSYGNLWQRGDMVTLSYQVAPDRASDSQLAAVSYLFHIPDSNLALLFSYLKSDSNVATVGDTNVIGRGTIVGLRLLMPIYQDSTTSSSLSVGFDYKTFDDATVLGADREPSPVTYVPLTAKWDGHWSSGASSTDVSLSAVLGTRGIGSDETDFGNKRGYARPNFAYLRAEASRLQSLPWGFQAYAKLNGQLAVEPLISNEEFSIGGLDTVRGYFESEALGDYGYALQTELRTPSLGEAVSWFGDTRGFTFVDTGKVGLRNPLLEQRATYNLMSVGAGLRMQALDHLQADVIGAHTLDEGASTRAGDNRVLFRLNGAF